MVFIVIDESVTVGGPTPVTWLAAKQENTKNTAATRAPTEPKQGRSLTLRARQEQPPKHDSND